MNQGSPLWLQFAYAQESFENKWKSPSLNYSYDRAYQLIAIGQFIQQNTLIAFVYTSDETEFSPAAYAGFGYTLTQTHIVAKHLMTVGSGNRVNIEARFGTNSYDSVGFADSKNTVLEVAGDYYLNNMQSIGGTFQKVLGDDNGQQGQVIAVHGTFFFSPTFSVAAEIYQFSRDGVSDDVDRLSVKASMRF